MKITRVTFVQSVLVSGMTGEKTQLTADVDSIQLSIDGAFLRIVPNGNNADTTLVPVHNVRWAWTRPDDGTKTTAVPAEAPRREEAKGTRSVPNRKPR